MKLKTGRVQLLSAFLNLTLEARILQVFRLAFGIISFLCVFIALIGPIFSIKFYIMRLSTTHLDVSKGIYDSLKNSVSSNDAYRDSNPSNQLPIDETLTNSEITILSQYAEAQVENAPQYFLGSLWQFCVGYYNITEYPQVELNQVKYVRHDDRLDCKRVTKQTGFFDYRRTLQLYDMESVLAYSLQSAEYSDKGYTERSHKLLSRYQMVPITLVLNCIATFFTLLFQYVLYSNRKGAKDLTSLPRFLMHMVTVASVVCFILITIAVTTITSDVLSLKSEIQASFGSFGLALLYGKLWMTLIWLGFGGSVMVMLSWVISVWCADIEEDLDPAEGYSYSRPGDYGKRVISRQTQIFENSGVTVNRNRSMKEQAFETSEEITDDYIQDNHDDDVESSLYETVTRNNSVSASLNQPLSTQGDIFYDPKEEEETSKLRQLGESLSRNASVRQLNSKLTKKPTLSSLAEAPMSEEDARKFIHDHKAYSPLPHHYRVETFDGFNEESNSNSLGRSATMNRPSKVLNSTPFNTRRKNSLPINMDDVNMHSNNPFLMINDNDNELQKNRDSLLNEDEVNFLESNPFVNKL